MKDNKSDVIYIPLVKMNTSHIGRELYRRKCDMERRERVSFAYAPCYGVVYVSKKIS